MNIEKSVAIKPLINLFENRNSRGKNDATTFFFNLSILHENKGRIMQAGAVKVSH